jgi:hypothetical protein
LLSCGSGVEPASTAKRRCDDPRRNINRVRQTGAGCWTGERRSGIGILVLGAWVKRGGSPLTVRRQESSRWESKMNDLS